MLNPIPYHRPKYMNVSFHPQGLEEKTDSPAPLRPISLSRYRCAAGVPDHLALCQHPRDLYCWQSKACRCQGDALFSGVLQTLKQLIQHSWETWNEYLSIPFKLHFAPIVFLVKLALSALLKTQLYLGLGSKFFGKEESMFMCICICTHMHVSILQVSIVLI